MLSPKSMIIFYSVCAAIVVWMLFRLWRKGRANKVRAAIPQATRRRNPSRESIAAATPVTAPTLVRAVTEPVSPPPAPAAPLFAAANGPSMAASVAATPAMHVPVSATQSQPILEGNWQGRRLLESSGLLPRSTNTMPRILPEDVPGVDDSDRIFGSWLNPAFASLLPESEERREQARKDLKSGGFYNPHAWENLAASRYALMMLSMIVFGSLLLIVPPQLEPWMVAGCVLGPMLAWAMPMLYVRGKAKERQHEIERAMPDLLDMLNMCVSQGLTVGDSLLRVGRDFRAVYPALSQELNIVNEQAKISTLPTALENFSQRIDLPEVHSLTSLLIQTERMGTSISEALITYSDTMRESQRQQADEKGNRATFRLLFPTVLCLMPAVYLFLLGPAINELQRFFQGGGMDSLNSGSQVVQRMNASRNQGGNAGVSAQVGQSQR